MREDTISHWSCCSKAMPKMKILENILYSYIIRISICAGKTNMLRRSYFFIFFKTNKIVNNDYACYKFPRLLLQTANWFLRRLQCLILLYSKLNVCFLEKNKKLFA